MAGKILVLVEDLFFLSRIEETARLLGIAVQAVHPDTLPARLADASAVMVDLNHPLALDALRTLKSLPESAPVIGFVSHVQTDLIAAARAAGCDEVMARSAFTRKLPELLQQYNK
ncbi:MAG: hypothetical protein ACRD2B_10410 [Terriglobia bacterium]